MSNFFPTIFLLIGNGEHRGFFYIIKQPKSFYHRMVTLLPRDISKTVGFQYIWIHFIPCAETTSTTLFEIYIPLYVDLVTITLGTSDCFVHNRLKTPRNPFVQLKISIKQYLKHFRDLKILRTLRKVL